MRSTRPGGVRTRWGESESRLPTAVRQAGRVRSTRSEGVRTRWGESESTTSKSPPATSRAQHPLPFRLRVSLCSPATPRQAKNICEIYGQTGYIRTLYTYTPYGAVTAAGDISQPIQWSSEFNDTELGLVYYNYRHYNSICGKWIGRDFLTHDFNYNIYCYASNNPFQTIGLKGLENENICDTISKNNNTIDQIRAELPETLQCLGDTMGLWDALKAFNSNPSNHTNCNEKIIIYNADLIVNVLTSGFELDMTVLNVLASPRKTPNNCCVYHIERRAYGNVFKGKTPQEIDKMF